MIKDSVLVSEENFGFDPPMGSTKNRPANKIVDLNQPERRDGRSLGWANQGDWLSDLPHQTEGFVLQGKLWFCSSNWFFKRRR